MWLEHDTTIEGAKVFLEFEPDGRVRTRTSKDMTGYVAANVTWYLSENTIHILTFEDSEKKVVTAEAAGVIKGESYRGNHTGGNVKEPLVAD